MTKQKHKYIINLKTVGDEYMIYADLIRKNLDKIENYKLYIYQEYAKLCDESNISLSTLDTDKIAKMILKQHGNLAVSKYQFYTIKNLFSDLYNFSGNKIPEWLDVMSYNDIVKDTNMIGLYFKNIEDVMEQLNILSGKLEGFYLDAATCFILSFHRIMPKDAVSIKFSDIDFDNNTIKTESMGMETFSGFEMDYIKKYAETYSYTPPGGERTMYLKDSKYLFRSSKSGVEKMSEIRYGRICKNVNDLLREYNICEPFHITRLALNGDFYRIYTGRLNPNILGTTNKQLYFKYVNTFWNK